MAKVNTPGLGIEYEVHIPAYFALLLNSNEDVEDFTLRSNVKEFGNLDDLLVDIKTRNGKEFFFAFQLKHKENYSKNLLPTNFEAKGDFQLEKYCAAFKELSEENQKYHFILYTNKNFDRTRSKEVTKFRMLENNECGGKDFFNTSGDCRNIYKFEATDNTDCGKNVKKEEYERFFSKFSLYTGQINFNDLDKTFLLDILAYREQFLKYVDFFRRWHRGEFTNKTLDKKTINIHLVDIYLSAFVINNYHLSDGSVEDLDLFEAAVKKFDLTIFGDSNIIDLLEESKNLENLKNCHPKLEIYMEKYQMDNHGRKAIMECLLRLGKESKIIDRSTKNLNPEAEIKLLYYFFEKPLMIHLNQTSKNIFYKMMDLYRTEENEIRFVILGQVDRERLERFQIFQKLTDVATISPQLYEGIIKKSSLSLQGRPRITLEQLIQSSEEISEFISPKEIFTMLKTSYTIGEEKEMLPDHYIPRTLSCSVLEAEEIFNQCTTTKDVIIINFGNRFGNFKKLLEKMKIRVVEIEAFRSTDGSAIIPLTEECPVVQFEELCQRKNNGNLHYFRLVEEDKFMLVMTTKNIFNRQYRLRPLKKVSIEENSTHLFLKNPVNFLCAQPGMGKSTMMKCLKNRCDGVTWGLLLDLKGHNSFLKKRHPIGAVLEYFMELSQCEDTFLKKLKSVFIEKKKVVIFFDGVDEIEETCADNIASYAKELSLMGYRVWVSSRQNLQQKLEEIFNIFATEFEYLSESNQKKYISNRLKSEFKEGEVQHVIDKIFDSVDVTHNHDVLGIPLQLRIITQIFLDDRSYYQYLNSNLFVLTKMYRIFFEGRFKHSMEKLQALNPHLDLTDLDDYLEKYEIAALHSFLGDSIFEELSLDKRRNHRFLDNIRKKKDPMGVIVKLSEENRAVFEHLTFMEYFLCVFLANNLSKVQLLRETIFFEGRENLRRIFNIKLAEKNPLHLAVIYQDVAEVKRSLKITDPNTLDEGGRNVLHVAAMCCKRHPNFMYVYNLVLDGDLGSFRGEDLVSKRILKILLEQGVDPLRKDCIFQWNPLEYASQLLSLYFLEEVFDKLKLPPEKAYDYIKTMSYHDIHILYYSLRFGYPNLLSSLVGKVDFAENFRSYGTELGPRLYNFVAKPECEKKVSIARLLLDVIKEGPFARLFKKVLLQEGFQVQ